MSGTNSVVGTYGTIPEDIYLRKIEHTDVFEDVDQVESYMRNILKDTRPDPYFFESDAPRRDNQSTAAINLRVGGARTLTQPDLPEGTFLNFDPECIDEPSGPDFKKAVAQANARASFINYYNDSDNSLPESMIHPQQMNKQIRGAQTWTKNQMLIFDTALDNMVPGGAALKAFRYSGKLKTVGDGVIADVTDATTAQRMGNTAALSDITLGFRTHATHRFKIAKYGQKRCLMMKSDAYTNREGAHVDHRMPISWDGMNISPALALLMTDLIKLKKRSCDCNQAQTPFGSALAMANRKPTVTPEDMTAILQQVAESQGIAANMMMDGTLITRSGLRFAKELSNDRLKINPEVMHFISKWFADNTNKQSTKHTTDDLRDKVKQTAQMNDGTVLVANKIIKTQTDPQQRRAATDQHYKEESKNVYNYSSLPAKPLPCFTKKDYYEAYARTSRVLAQRTLGARKHKEQTSDQFAGDTDTNALNGKTANRFTRGLGIKNKVREYMVNNDYDYGMNDAAPF